MAKGVAMVFLEIYRTSMKKILRPSAFVLLICFMLYPVIPYAPYKYITLFLLGSVVLRILLEIETSVADRLRRTEEKILTTEISIAHRLREVEDKLQDNHAYITGLLPGTQPPTWENYNAAQEHILHDIRNILTQRRKLRIEVLAVSAKYSWRMLEDHIPTILQDASFVDCKIEISMVLCNEKILREWNLDRWVDDLRITVNGIAHLKQLCKDAMNSGRLNIELSSYDSLPMWHGVLLEGNILYMGRTRWVMLAEGESPRLQVGSCEYRKFERNDRYGGNPRIQMFINWTERLRLRSREIRTVILDTVHA